MPNLNFVDKVVIVTGAGGSLGRTYALEFAKRGAAVIVNDLGSTKQGSDTSPSPADQVVAEIRANGGKAEANYDSVEFGGKIVESAIKHFKKIDVIVNNAGILRDKSFQNMSNDDWDSVFKTHVKGAFLITKAAWPHFKKQKYGRIVFTSSNSAIYGNFGQANYAAAKSALIGFSHTLALEGRKYNIHSNVVIPTAASRLTSDLLPQDELETLKPEYVAPVVVYLTHESCSETGKIVEAAAGWYGEIQAYRSKGNFLPASNAETIAKNWASITDMTSAKHFNSLQEVTADLLSCKNATQESPNNVLTHTVRQQKYFSVLKAIYDELNSQRIKKSKPSVAITFIYSEGANPLTHYTIGAIGGVIDKKKCVIAMNTFLLEQILNNKVLDKDVIKSGMLKVVGDETEKNVLNCLNQVTVLPSSKL